MTMQTCYRLYLSWRPFRRSWPSQSLLLARHKLSLLNLNLQHLNGMLLTLQSTFISWIIPHEHGIEIPNEKRVMQVLEQSSHLQLMSWLCLTKLPLATQSSHVQPMRFPLVLEQSSHLQLIRPPLVLEQSSHVPLISFPLTIEQRSHLQHEVPTCASTKLPRTTHKVLAFDKAPTCNS